MTIRDFFAPALVLGATLIAATARGQAAPPAEGDLFGPGAIPRIEITIAPEELVKLKAEPRKYVKATIVEGDRGTASEVGIKLKGAAGSFRDWDDRPALTVNAAKYRKGGRFHGLAKFHLNNSAQDETLLNELLAADLFRKAGVPAPRVGHARLRLDGREMGVYVLKEGFDRPFLERSFPDPTGNLYDGGFLQDLDAELERDEGSGPDDRSDLRAIVDAAADPDPKARARRLESLVDLDAFLSLMAMERMINHWDGYADKANNYRVYFDPRRGGKAVILPHGMDQVFGDPGAGLFDDATAILSAPIVRSDDLRRRYRARVERLVPLMSPADDLLRRVDEATLRLRPALEAIDPARAADHAGQVAALKERLVARAANLREQLARPDDPFQTFDERGSSPLNDWWSGTDEGEADLDTPLAIRAKGDAPSVASWRRAVVLGPGRYTLHADARLDRVIPPDDRPDEGGVSIGPADGDRSPRLRGTTEVVPLAQTFTIRDDRRRVTLVLELRAKSGGVRFSPDSLRLTREPDDTPRPVGVPCSDPGGE